MSPGRCSSAGARSRGRVAPGPPTPRAPAPPPTATAASPGAPEAPSPGPAAPWPAPRATVYRQTPGSTRAGNIWLRDAAPATGARGGEAGEDRDSPDLYLAALGIGISTRTRGPIAYLRSTRRPLIQRSCCASPWRRRDASHRTLRVGWTSHPQLTRTWPVETVRGALLALSAWHSRGGADHLLLAATCPGIVSLIVLHVARAGSWRFPPAGSQLHGHTRSRIGGT